MMDRSDLSKQELYESVKTIVDLEEGHPHIHLNQEKLFTLSSIAFQYLLYRSTKVAGAYIIRVEDSSLAEKLSKKSKDQTTRKFLQNLLLPRRLKYGKSTFYLDYFHINTWAMTNEIPRHLIKGAMIVKNTSEKPMEHVVLETEADGGNIVLGDLPKDYYLTSLTETVPKTITIAFEKEYQGLHPLCFQFLKKDSKRSVSGVTLAKDLNWDSLDD